MQNVSDLRFLMSEIPERLMAFRSLNMSVMSCSNASTRLLFEVMSNFGIISLTSVGVYYLFGIFLGL